MTGPLNLHWDDPVWHEQAASWIEREATRAGFQLTGAIEQPHLYPWSTVLHVPTNRGRLFFKATAPETIYEIPLTAALAGWYPDRLPDLVAVDAPRGWMLMRDGGGMLRESIRPAKDITPWSRVIPLYAQLQVEAAAHVPELLALGVPDWRLARLPGLFGELLEDREIFRTGRTDGLSAVELARVLDLPPRVAALCTDLASFGIPESINHGDFHDGNVLVKDGRVTFFDWGDGNVTHPFASLRTFFVSIEIALGLEDYAFTPEMEALLHSYLEPWESFASRTDLLAAYPLSRCAATVVKALSWHQTVSGLEGAAREKYAYIVPELMRELIYNFNRL